MNKQSHQERIRVLYQMLFEMATGNNSFRIPLSDRHDELDELALIFNWVAKGMHSKILKAGFVNPHYRYQTLVQTTFILDDDFMIESFSFDLPAVLGYSSEELNKMDFHKILAIQLLPFWDSIKKQIVIDDTFHHTIHLLFVTAENQIIPYFCRVSKLMYTKKIVINTITTTLQESIVDTSNGTNLATARPSEAAVIQKLYDYILNNLEEPLPSTKKLSKMFGINEFRLKDGFRHFFNTSIYQFYTEERLKKAHLLILETSIPLKEIAFISGYNYYINFYKAFKKRFGYSPSELKRENMENNTD